MKIFLALCIFAYNTLIFAQQPVTSAIKPYTNCTFNDGLQVVQLDALPTTPMVRQIDTPAGLKDIAMLQGERIMFAYPSEDFYANVKAEQLDTKDYLSEKKDLIAQLDIYTKDGNTIAHDLPSLGDLQVQGINRSKLEGGVLGIYLFFDDKQAIVTTMYLLNGEPDKRRFQSLPEYAKLRDSFLSNYASCIRQNQKLTSSNH